MILPIVLYGDPVLQKRAAEVPENYPELSQLADNLFETMYAASGIGLAAPQVGISLRVFVLDASLYDSEMYQGQKLVVVNPELLEESGEKWAYSEGCLSIPEIRGDVMRQPALRLRYQDLNREVHEVSMDGMLARIVQHEFDHLEGRLFVDLMHPLRRRMIHKKLQMIRNGQLRPEYKHRVR